MDDQKSGVLSRSMAWLKQPFNTQGSALNWVLFFGLVIVALWFWSHVVMTITEDV
jgi:hypothetical protein